jgi:hypothetical protein
MPIAWPLTGLVLTLGISTGVARAACTSIDQTHAQWTAILQRWVADGLVDYAGLRRDGRGALETYLAGLSGACAADYEQWTREERIAFWLNAYNAATVRLILEHYPIASIRKIGWLPGAAFREKLLPMEGLKAATISLDDIENGTLRSAFREPRIHFALVCAARSCPALRNEAYRGAELDRQLDEQARQFLHDPRKNRVDTATRTLWLSPIFKWYRGDFEASGGSLPGYLTRYLGDVGDYDVEFLDYDWSLNDRAAAATDGRATARAMDHGGRR